MSDPVILVPLDGTMHALSALPVARVLSDLQKAPVRLLHVTERVGPLAETATLLGLDAAQLRGATLASCAGIPAEVILRAAADSRAQAIVLCTHTADVRPAGAIGRTAIAVLRGASCPVVLVNPALALRSWAVRRLLIPHEGSPTVSDALAPAAQLARAAAAELIVLQVANASEAQESGSIAPPVYMDQPQHEWPAWTQEFIQRFACICPLADLHIRLLVAHGDPASETLRVAREESADLIVVAWKGHWGGARARTFKAVLQGAPCPIMVMRTSVASP